MGFFFRNSRLYFSLPISRTRCILIAAVNLNGLFLWLRNSRLKFLRALIGEILLAIVSFRKLSNNSVISSLLTSGRHARFFRNPVYSGCRILRIYRRVLKSFAQWNWPQFDLRDSISIYWNFNANVDSVLYFLNTY